ncbi:hypothetical protein [Chitinophaga pinensis]|uniref:Uncharacterized protein n=1 Tax=Chitinophaga pinensis TaxID=79329 RepID=A0A5C6LII8_9BACT|nr:hypothetical protein [Chitinophaga pinensis]TWV92573.1 hypothetical protein FEF09_28310 [Chitinophaga pinensis]
MKRFIVCNNCGGRISNLLEDQIELDFSGRSEEMLLRTGQYGIDNSGDYYISISDKHNLSYHHDLTRMQGCCGASVNGLPNLVCICKSAIGREVTDCCTAHYVVLYKKGITLKEDTTGLLAEILNLSVDDETKSQYEILFHFGEIASVLVELRK